MKKTTTIAAIFLLAAIQTSTCMESPAVATPTSISAITPYAKMFSEFNRAIKLNCGEALFDFIVKSCGHDDQEELISFALTHFIRLMDPSCKPLDEVPEAPAASNEDIVLELRIIQAIAQEDAVTLLGTLLNQCSTIQEKSLICNAVELLLRSLQLL